MDNKIPKYVLAILAALASATGVWFIAVGPGDDPEVIIVGKDGGTLPFLDASTPTPDAATPTPDAEPPAPDATQPTPDAAPPTPDAAPPAPDAAPSTPDAAPPTPDAAPPTPDAGTTPPDAGPGTPGTYECGPGTARTFDVGSDGASTGPNHVIVADLGGVPWTTLGPGDTVRVFHRSEPYRQRVLFSTQGTEANPITLCGVPSVTGQMPVLDGAGSIPAPSAGFRNELHGNLGMIVGYASTATAWNDRPAWLVIQGLEITNVYGAGWIDGSAAIRLNDGGDNIVVRGNYIHDSDGGLFVSSTGDGPHLAENILIEGNIFINNGNSPTAAFRSHHTYVQGVGMTYQGNYYGPVRPNSGSTSLKDRSPGSVIRYNWIAGGSISIDLVEPQDHYDAVSGHPLYDVAWVYGNYIEATDIGRAVHFGGDVLDPSLFRHGPLYFYHNTVHLVSSAGTWDAAVFGPDTPETIVRAYNNIVWRDGGRSDGPGIVVVVAMGTVELFKNWLGPKWFDYHRNDGVTIIGKENVITGTTNPLNPDGTLNSTGPDFAAEPLPAALYTPPFQFKNPAGFEPRDNSGTILIGAFQ